MNNENYNKKNRKNLILIVKIKNGNNIIDIEINTNYNIENEIMKKLKEKLNYDRNIINLLHQKIKNAVEITNNIFKKPMKLHSYKQMANINNFIFNESKINKNINEYDLKKK